MTTTLRLRLNLVLGLALGVALSTAGLVWAQKEAADPVPLDELRLFTEVLDRIKQDYVEDTTDKTLLDAAIRGMLAGLDPHSSYLDEDAYAEMQAGTSGEFGGLGIEVDMEDGFVRVVAPIEDTPADRAGVMAGDLIIRLDDAPVKGMSLSDAVKRMRGAPDTEITLTVVREGEDAPLEIVVVRDVIEVQSVKTRMLEPGYGYARITQFQVPTARKLKESLNTMIDSNGEPLKGLVLDLRNNPGGVLTGAVDVSDLFLESGEVVETRGRTDGTQQIFEATSGDLLNGAPLIVLVNGGSASASEIVAGALQDQRRAVIMGQRTFGKGSVQTIMPLANGAAVKLTTARYYTPDGRSIQAEGIEPDITLRDFTLSDSKNNGLSVREIDLQRHLINENGEVEEEEKPAEGSELAEDDYALYEALNLLKALALLDTKRA